MNHHYRQGFQRTFTNDVYKVEEQLQAYDKHLYVMYNTQTDEHLIMDDLVGLAVMKIPQPGFPVLNSSVVDHMKRIHTANGFSAVHHITASDDAREREYARRSDDLASNFARDTLKSAQKLANYG